MELVKDIYFNTDKLIENTKVKVSYTGKFYQGNNDKVFLHYGFGKDWNNVTDIEMAKTDLGYQAELNLIGKDTVNFCFKNQNNEWDNNYGKNYIFNIEKNSVAPDNAEKCGNLVFWGKTFGSDEKKKTSSTIYWNSENTNTTNNADENTSGVIEDVVNSEPNSIDTIISNKADVALNTAPTTEKALGVTLEKPAGNDCFAVIKPAPSANTTAKVVTSPVTSNVKATANTNSIALAPTGFSYWTKKIKANVCKFLDYLPKLISGNYKRDVNINTANTINTNNNK